MGARRCHEKPAVQVRKKGMALSAHVGSHNHEDLCEEVGGGGAVAIPKGRMHN